MAAVDTNILVRLLVADDRQQTERATTFLESHRPLWISTVVLVESVWVLSTVYGWSKAQILAMLNTSIASRDFAFQSVQSLREALRQYASSKADFSDCLALELARTEGHLPFGTFDKAAAKLRDAIIP
ncbi:MAG TPA: type II toxin-antitoxin system VapC family toxin [Candidatus Angelobacter sp.]|jgi:predicted nucleic-acid-binding protein|nr:type II toxin-antitoxin system VapC family toxin [Candidatus Angelobacter sp.]